MSEHKHKWTPLITFNYSPRRISSYSKCECGLMRHDNDGDIFNPKNLANYFEKWRGNLKNG